MTARSYRSGQSVLIVAFSMVAFIGMLGLAIDMGYLRYMQRRLQTAADNAAIAGALQIPFAATGGTSVTTAAVAAATEDNFTNGQNGVAVNVCAPPNTSGAYGACPSTPFAGTGSYPLCTTCAEVTVTDTQVPTFFAQNFGAPAKLTLSATAVAEGGLNCIYALDTSTGAGEAIDLILSIVDSTCGVVDNSNLDGLGFLCAPSIDLKGSDELVGGTCSPPFNPARPVKMTTAASDPLANLAAPSVSNPPAVCPSGGSTGSFTVPSDGYTVTPTPTYCGGTIITGKTGITVTPGNYWGSPAFTISNSNVTFQAGTYNIISRTAGIPGIQMASTGFNTNQISFGAGTYTIVGGVSDAALFGSAVNWNNTAGTAAMFIIDGGGLTLVGNQGASGNQGGSVGQTTGGVTFYNTGTAATGLPTTYGTIVSYFDYSSGFCGSRCQLSAPTSGPYTGILFFNDRSNTATRSCGLAGTVGACFGADFSFVGEISHAGAYYFANNAVGFSFDFGAGAPYTILIAKDITWILSAQFTFNDHYETLPNGSPLTQGTAILVQ